MAESVELGEDFMSDPITEPVITEPVAEEKPKRGRPAKEVAEPIKEPKVEVPVEPEPEPEPKGKKEPEAEPEVDENLYDELADRLGYQFEDDEDYEDSTDGLVAFIQKQKEVGAQEMVENYFSSVHPKGAEMFDLLNMISDLPMEEQDQILDDFYKGKNPDIDFESVNIDEEAAQKSVLKTFYKKNGFSDEQITKKLDKFEIAGMLKDEAEDAIDHLIKLQKEESKKTLIKEKAEADARKESTKKYYQALQNTIESGKINNFTIPVNERKATFDYIAKGEALSKLNEMWATPEGRVQLAIMLKNDFKLDKYINQAAKTQVVSGLRDRLKAGQSKLKSATTKDNGAAIDWDNLEY
jgi:hypothetical protein